MNEGKRVAPSGRRWARSLTAGACMAALLVAGCSSDSDSDGGSATSASNAASGTPAKTAPGSGGDSLCVTSSVSFGLAPLFFEGYKQIAEQYGLKYIQKIAQPDGNLQSAANNIEQCIGQHPAAIVGIATENAAVAKPIAAAGKAGIPYIADQSGSPVDGVRATIWGNEYQNSAKLIGYLLTNFKEPQKVFVLKASALPVVNRRTTGFLSAAAIEKGQIEVAGSAELDLAAGVANSATEKVTAALRGDDDISVVVAPWDDPAAGALAALKRLNRDDVTVLTYDGLEPTYSAMRGGEERYGAIAALPSEAFLNVRQIIIGQLLQNELPESVNALCTGPLVTAANIPDKGALTQGGECVIDGKVLSAAELKQQATEEVDSQ